MVVPSKFREKLGSHFMLGCGFDECLLIYSMEDWEEFAQKLSALPTNDEEARELKRYFFGKTLEVEIDSNGRAPLPPQLRDFVGIDKKVVFVGDGDKAELWPEEVYNEKYLPTDKEDAAAKRASVNAIAAKFRASGVSL